MKDRIDDWWIQSPPQDSGKRALVECYEGTLKLAEAPREVLGLHDEEGVVLLDNAADIIERVYINLPSCVRGIQKRRPRVPAVYVTSAGFAVLSVLAYVLREAPLQHSMGGFDPCSLIPQPYETAKSAKPATSRKQSSWL